MKLKIIKHNEKLIMPTRGHYDDAGLDCYSLNDYELKPNEMTLIPLGFGIELPNGYMATIRPRSSMNFKNILTQIGTVDSGYRGEIKCILVNLNNEPMNIKKGDKICQIVIEPVIIVDLVDDLGEKRGVGGFGSTDIKVNSDGKDFKERLKTLLAIKNITQKELCDLTGITPSSMSRYVSGIRIPRIDTIMSICKVLGTTPSYLLLGD